MKPVDEVVRDRIAPVLRRAGFQRRRRHFWFDSASGDRAYVEVRPFKLGFREAEFFVDLGVQPRIWADWLGRDGGETRDVLWADRLMVPGRRPPMADHWSFDLVDEPAGDLLATELSARLPEILGLLDPALLLGYARTLPRPGRKISVRPEIALAVMLATQGPSDELEQSLGALATDPDWVAFDTEFVAFVRGWIAQHPADAQD
ncbi:hypothetical protein [Nocardioides sp. Root140]|uniref:hypothetical protein n=1 Tax=Nocardioides sp. Root140 TaxID=1736460 RepID=UPI000A512E36|nr:hypothetical protein [Nocardioides sp. Root140]